ncbi:uncharacterized protein METZ01_LOCUS499799, partial [marine metagenome]
PKLQFVRDHGIERGNRVMEILDELETEETEGRSDTDRAEEAREV